jgi:serine/threonine-protein kinase
MQPSMGKMKENPPNDVSLSSIQQQLDKILRSDVFARSDRMKRFLSFIVAQTLKGEQDTLKEYSIGLAVFDKPKDFDPRLDPIVRVEAGRFRSKLREYYMTEGRKDAIWFKCPKRSYLPVFESHPGSSAPPPPTSGNMTSSFASSVLAGTANPIEQTLHRQDTVGTSSIAVLPFVALSRQRDLGCLCDGITEEIINHLSVMGVPKVIARTSVMQFKDSARDVRHIGMQLNVDTVLDGSIRRLGKSLRIMVQLINVADSYHLWSVTYDKKWDDILSIQQEISQPIVKALRIHLLDGGEPPQFQGSTYQPEAYSLYLRGRYFWNKRSEHGLQQAIGYFEQATVADPRYALAYTGLADCYAALVELGALAPTKAWSKAAEAAHKALEIDERLSQAHSLLGNLKAHFNWDWAGAEVCFQSAIELDPHNATAHQWYAVYCLVPQRRLEHALVEIKRACALDPMWPAVRARVGWVLYSRRQFEEALAQWQRTIELDPTFYLAYLYQGFAYEQLNKPEEALASFKQAQLLSRGMILTTSALGRCYGLMGKRGEALQLLTRLLDLSKQRYVSPFDLASVYAGLGETDASFEWLNQACEHRSGRLIYLKVDPAWDPLKSDPRLLVLLTKLGLVN